MREIPGIIKAAPPAALRPIPSSSPSPSEMTPKVRPPSAQQPVQTLQNRGDRVASELIRPNILNATSDARRNNYQIGQEERAEQTRIRQEGRLEDIKIRQEGRTEESQVRQEDRAEERGGRQDEARAVLERELAEFNSAIKKDYAEWGHKNLGGEQKMDLLNREADAMNVRLALEASRIRSSLLNAEIEIMSKVELGEKSKQLGTFITGARDTIRASKVQETFNAAFPGDDDHEDKTEWVDEVLVPSGVIPSTPGGWNGLTESQKIVAMDYMYNNPNQNAQAIRHSIDARYSDQLTALDKAEMSRLQMQTLSQSEGAMAKGKLKEIADSLSPIIQLGSDTTVRMRKGGEFVPADKPKGPVPEQPQHTPPKQQGNNPITQKPLPSATTTAPPVTTAPVDDGGASAAADDLFKTNKRPKNVQGEDMRSDALEGTIIAKRAKDAGRKLGEVFLNAGIELPPFSSLEEAEEWWDRQGDGMKTMVLGATGMAAHTIAPALLDEARSGFEGTKGLVKGAGDMIKMPWKDNKGDVATHKAKQGVRAEMADVHDAGKSPSISSAGRKQVADRMGELEKLAHDHGVKPFKGPAGGSYTIEDRYKYYSDQLDKNVIQKNWQKLPAKIRQKLDEDKALRESRKNSKGIKAGAAKVLRGTLYGLGIGLTAHDLFKISGNHAEAEESERLLKEMQVAMDAKLAAGKIVAAERAARKLVDEDYQRGRSANHIEMSAADARDAGKITQEVYDATVRYLNETGRQQGAMSEGELGIPKEPGKPWASSNPSPDLDPSGHPIQNADPLGQAGASVIKPTPSTATHPINPQLESRITEIEVELEAALSSAQIPAGNQREWLESRYPDKLEELERLRGLIYNKQAPDLGSQFGR